MPRPSQLIHPQREPAPVRPAATVLLLRDSPHKGSSSFAEAESVSPSTVGLRPRILTSTGLGSMISAIRSSASWPAAPVSSPLPARSSPGKPP